MTLLVTETESSVEINTLFEQARSLIDQVHSDGKLSPLEPGDTGPSPRASGLSGTIDELAVVFVIDGASLADDFDAYEVISNLTDRLAEKLSLVAQPWKDASEAHRQAISAASSFRTVLSAQDTDLGELRLTAAILDGEKSSENGPVEREAPNSEAAGTNGAADAAGELSLVSVDPESISDQELAGRLPNLASVDMNVAVELGRVSLPIRELLGLGNGSVVRLGTRVGEPFDILVNGKAAARGDLVVVGGRLAVRIRELLGMDS